jgi:methyl coenzyme M reductase alpha subunit
MFIDIFGDIFVKDFEKSLALKPDNTPEEKSSKQYLTGIATQSASKDPNIPEITKLFNFLNQMDQRRNTNWQLTFPWLEKEFEKYNLIP